MEDVREETDGFSPAVLLRPIPPIDISEMEVTVGEVVLVAILVTLSTTVYASAVVRDGVAANTETTTRHRDRDGYLGREGSPSCVGRASLVSTRDDPMACPVMVIAGESHEINMASRLVSEVSVNPRCPSDEDVLVSESFVEEVRMVLTS